MHATSDCQPTKHYADPWPQTHPTYFWVHALRSANWTEKFKAVCVGPRPPSLDVSLPFPQGLLLRYQKSYWFSADSGRTSLIPEVCFSGGTKHCRCLLRSRCPLCAFSLTCPVCQLSWSCYTQIKIIYIILQKTTSLPRAVFSSIELYIPYISYKTRIRGWFSCWIPQLRALNNIWKSLDPSLDAVPASCDLCGILLDTSIHRGECREGTLSKEALSVQLVAFAQWSQCTKNAFCAHGCNWLLGKHAEDFFCTLARQQIPHCSHCSSCISAEVMQLWKPTTWYASRCRFFCDCDHTNLVDPASSLCLSQRLSHACLCLTL